MSWPCKMDTLSFWSLSTELLIQDLRILLVLSSYLSLYWLLSWYLYLSLLPGHLVQDSRMLLVCPVSCVHSQVDILRSYSSPRCPGRLTTTAKSSSVPWCRTTNSYSSWTCEVHSCSFYSLLSSSCFSYPCDSSSSSSSSSLSLSFGPAPLPTLPSVIYSLFSFYLLPAWTPVPGVL